MRYQRIRFPIFVYGWRWKNELDCFNAFRGFDDCREGGESGISADEFLADFRVKFQHEGVYQLHIVVLAMDSRDQFLEAVLSFEKSVGKVCH